MELLVARTIGEPGARLLFAFLLLFKEEEGKQRSVMSVFQPLVGFKW